MLNGLVVTADDFGLAVEVNAAVELAYKKGVLTAASLMVGGPAAKDAVIRARTLPRLAVGLHLVLVDGAPTLPRGEIPDLLDANGFLRKDMARFGFEVALRPHVRSQLRREIRAQYEAFLATGLPLNHVDVHKHYHLHPLVAADIISIGRQLGVTSLRVPVEPKLAFEPFLDRHMRPSRWLTPWIAYLGQRARRAGLLTANAVFGCAWSGRLSEERLIMLLSYAGRAGLTEIYCHPAVRDDFEGHAPKYHYQAELEALLSARVAGALEKSGRRLTTYPRFLTERANADGTNRENASNWWQE